MAHRRFPSALAQTCFLAAAFLALTLTSPSHAVGQVVGLQRDMFLVDGSPKFLFMVSYFDALDVSDAGLDADLEYLRTTVKAQGIRVFPNWWRRTNPLQFATPDCSGTGMDCTLMRPPANGTRLNQDRLGRLILLLEKAKARGLLVDVSLARETVYGLSKDDYRAAMYELTDALRGHHNLILDLQNEWTIVGGFTAAELDAMADEVRARDPGRIVVASSEEGGHATAAAAGDFAVAYGMTAVAYHDPRYSDWYTDGRLSSVLQSVRTTAPDLPFYLQEPQKWQADPIGSHFSDAARYAKKHGAAAWVFHTESSFVLDGTRLYTVLSSQERAALEGAGATADSPANGWGDLDSDGLKDSWETYFDVYSPYGDEDGDGIVNLDEFVLGSHPRSTAANTRYFAEGTTSSFFSQWVSIANPGSSSATVMLRLYTSDGRTLSRTVKVAPLRRISVDTREVQGANAPSGVQASTSIESSAPVAADRYMTWNAASTLPYGSHLERGIAAQSVDWYLAEGATHSGFALFYLIQNPTAGWADVEVTYFRPSPNPPVVKTYSVAPASRFNIWVNTQDPGLASTDVSAKIHASRPIIVERAMYLPGQGREFDSGHDSAGVVEPSLRWTLSEGSTGPYFDMFVLIANPSMVSASVRADYHLPSGSVITKYYSIPPRSRSNVWVDYEDPALSDTAVSTVLESLTPSAPIVVERALWWPGAYPQWYEAHNSPGDPTGGARRWVIADADDGGPTGAESYTLVYNSTPRPQTLAITVLIEGGSPAAYTAQVGAGARSNIYSRSLPHAIGRPHSLIIECTSCLPPSESIFVETAKYAGSGWAAGGAALAAPMP